MYFHDRFGIKHACVGLFCEDYPTLRDRQLSKIKYEFPRWLGRMKDTQEEGLVFQLKDEYGGGFIALRNLDDPLGTRQKPCAEHVNPSATKASERALESAEIICFRRVGSRLGEIGLI